MNTLSPEPIPREQCTFYVHGFGLQALPMLHDLADAPGLLMAGRAVDLLMDDAVPASLIDTLKGARKEDVARFFLMWINAGFDFEAASWSEYLAMHRVMFPHEESPEPGEPQGCTDVAPVGQGLALASQLDSLAEHIADQIVDNWIVLK